MIEKQKPLFLTLNETDRKMSLEALIFSSDKPLSTEELYTILFTSDKDNIAEIVNESDDLNVSEAETDEQINQNGDDKLESSIISKYINEINDELMLQKRPYSIIQVAGGWQFATRREYGELVSRLYKAKSKRRLSQASLEVLAIIAYRQPVTKSEIEHIRGVNSGDIVNTLIDKGYIESAGRKDVLGKPLMFATSNEFLKLFGLNSIDELPKLRDLEEFSAFDFDGINTIEIKIDEGLISEEEINYIKKEELKLKD